MTSWRIPVAVLAAAALCALSAVSAGAQPHHAPETPEGRTPEGRTPEAPTPEGAYAHDGLFLRMTLGMSWLSAQGDSPSRDLDVTGAGGLLSVSAGWSVAERLVLMGDFYGGEVYAPTVTVDGRTLDSRDDATFNLMGIGVGLAGYFPGNLHVMLSVGTGFAYMDYVGQNRYLETVETDFGLSLHSLIGYEWWIVPEGAVGIALEMLYLSATDGDDVHAPHLGVVSTGISLTATHN